MRSPGIGFLSTALLVVVCCSQLQAQKEKSLTITEDRGQVKTTTKIYPLKHVIAADIQPFVEGAVTRNNRGANCLSYRAGGKE